MRRKNLSIEPSNAALGFPSPAEDYLENNLDLNELLIKHPAATFFMRVAGNDLADMGIHDKDILIIDRSLEPVSGKVIVAAEHGVLKLKRVGDARLDTLVWGVVTYVIHTF